VASKRGSTTRPPRTSRTLRAENNPHSITSARYLFFGGKGGVGKTTAAAATAVFLFSQAKRDESILLFSTDPAHSLSDSLGIDIGDRLATVSESHRARLVAYEMDAAIALERFRHAHGKVLAEIAERGTFLDESDINELLSLSLPGLDEVMALFELSELDRSGVYSKVVIDTAPSGHTSRLLRLPDVFKRVSHALDLMAEKHRYIVAQFARRGARLDEVDLFLRDLNERIERVQKLLFDDTSTSFSLVAIPEAMSVMETERYATQLQEAGVAVKTLIVNRVEQQHAKCEYCRSRVAMQQPWLKKLQTTFRHLETRYIPLLPREVNGLQNLQEFSRLLWVDGKLPKTTKQTKAKKIERPETVGEFNPPSRRLIIFGGKGGVGKTSAAAAYAYGLAELNPDKKILVFSTDPAHSLSDSFDDQIGESKHGIAGQPNLDGMEIDPGKWFEELKQRYQAWIDQLFESLRGNSKFEIKFDREAMRELVELTPPGIDEIAALSAITDLLEQASYDTIVLDTAPTGHLIRFLELPQTALSWVRTFIKLLLKYQHIVHATEIAEELVALSRSIKTVLALLSDKNNCEFVPVAIPEKMSLEETSDLAESLKNLHVPFNRVLINGMIPTEAAADCEFCQTRLDGQQSVIEQLRRRLGKSVELYVAPQQPNEIRGKELLWTHFNSWRSLNSAKRQASVKNLPRKTAALKNVHRQGAK
jgi:arsenite-transporting ATPase